MLGTPLITFLRRWWIFMAIRRRRGPFFGGLRRFRPSARGPSDRRMWRISPVGQPYPCFARCWPTFGCSFLRGRPVLVREQGWPLWARSSRTARPVVPRTRRRRPLRGRSSRPPHRSRRDRSPPFAFTRRVGRGDSFRPIAVAFGAPTRRRSSLAERAGTRWRRLVPRRRRRPRRRSPRARVRLTGGAT